MGGDASAEKDSEDMDGRVILHIGRHKSGTSSLQHALTGSAARLAQAGYLYPKIGRKNVAQHFLADAFLDKNRRRPADVARADATIDDARRELAAWPGDAVLSSETFQNIVRPELVRMLFNPARTQVIAYLRDPYAYARSAYAQIVHAQRETGRFDAYLSAFEPRYALFLARWRDGFAPATLSIRAYDRRTLVDGDIVRDFAAAAALPEGVLIGSGKDHNPSIGGALLEFKRALNLVPDLPQSYDAWSRISMRDPGYRAKPSVPAAAVRAFRARIAAEMHAIAARYPPLAILLDPPPDVAEAEPDVDAFRSIWQALDAEAPAVAASARRALLADRPADPVSARVADAAR